MAHGNNVIEPTLCQGKIFNTWQQAFDIIKGTYETQSNEKQTTTKRIGCPWHINLSEPQSKNLHKFIYITTFHDTHSHNLNPEIIQFGNNKHIPSEIMKEIEFLTIQYLYHAIQSFRPQNKNDSNDAAKLYTKLLENSQNNPMWKVAIKFDDNNTLTYLFWMTPSQLELWFQFSDIVVQDVTCKTNRYDVALNLIEKRQLSEDKNHQLILWKAAIPCLSTQITVPAFMFSSIDKELMEYLPPAILELQRNEIRQYIPDARQTTVACMISDVDKEQITSMWAITVGNNLNKDLSKEPFLVATKFEDEITPIIPESSIPFLTAVKQTSMHDSISQHERLTDIQLYGKINELAQNSELDKENQSLIIKNSNKQTKSRGRPKGTKRIKAFHEKTSTVPLDNSKQYNCGLCGNMGHNKRNCNQIS
ncbi:3150_t:CDS:2 [Diversispora eburnea]|uniref:3150_t:CDS:1 n=1 Tax=Diversispora eburnea TaxID=1213867 RepID=A0A9N9G244_9GLOM|nr:3150_t:CDS:2 [Diversispora eburnea]